MLLEPLCTSIEAATAGATNVEVVAAVDTAENISNNERRNDDQIDGKVSGHIGVGDDDDDCSLSRVDNCSVVEEHVDIDVDFEW